MNLELYKKYGNYNEDEFFIMEYEKWDCYAQNRKLYKRKKTIAWLCLLIPIVGILFYDEILKEMGLSSI